ncbi:MAG TPA: glycosyltransferase family 2 protein [Bacteroidia bacterium]|jgi:glycosyltransferase involved in cell wall biosynthesis|nr:glycosyltransferase family 2 protein [Bacteroidia bacterium]
MKYKTPGGDDKTPLVSIITIIYNGENYIEDCIKSIINQSYKNIQYIIIDGGSTDRSLEIINQYSSNIDILVSEKDNGISDAFNKGIKNAEGEIIGLLNSDDKYSEFAVQAVVDSYLNNAELEGIYYGDILYFDDDNSFELIADANKLWKYMSIFHPATFVTKGIYNKFGGYSEEFNFAMDCEFIHRCLYNHVPFIHINQTLAHFRLEGTSSRNYIKSHKEFYKSVKKYNYTISAEFFLYWNIAKKVILNTQFGRYMNKRRHLLSWILSGKAKR